MEKRTDGGVTGNSAVSGDGGEFMLFGVRVVVDSMRKSVSMNNLSQYEQTQDVVVTNINKEKEKDEVAATGYASADDAVHNSSSNRERKRGVPWTEEEHKRFLVGLQNVGKGDWRGISRNYVKTRTPTQVASHAQKYFLRRSNLNRRRRRSSLFDITTDSVDVMTSPMEKEQVKPLHDKITSHSQPPSVETNNASLFSMMPALPVTSNLLGLPVTVENSMQGVSLRQCNNTSNHVSMKSNLDLNLNPCIDPSALSLKLSVPFDQREGSSRHSAYQAMPSYSKGDSNSAISVA
jgi:SHAQKYF class myb-like DNA-binding protein